MRVLQMEEVDMRSLLRTKMCWMAWWVRERLIEAKGKGCSSSASSLWPQWSLLAQERPRRLSCLPVSHPGRHRHGDGDRGVPIRSRKPWHVYHHVYHQQQKCLRRCTYTIINRRVQDGRGHRHEYAAHEGANWQWEKHQTTNSRRPYRCEVKGTQEVAKVHLWAYASRECNCVQ